MAEQFGTFTLTFTLSRAIEDNERLAPTLTLEGTYSFDVQRGNVHDVSLDREIVAWTAPDGKQCRRGHTISMIYGDGERRTRFLQHDNIPVFATSPAFGLAYFCLLARSIFVASLVAAMA